MRRIKEKAARLRRYPRGRGFGVQSPNDYNFITKVVKGRIDKDCCAVTDKENEDVHKDGYKFVHLCYRVAQYLKPSRCICLTHDEDNVSHYVKAAVPDVILEHSYESIYEDGKCLVILSPAVDYTAKVGDILNAASENMWMIVEGIRTDDETYKAWLKITDDMRARITFDLYNYGIICFDKKRYKQKYKIYL